MEWKVSSARSKHVNNGLRAYGPAHGKNHDVGIDTHNSFLCTIM